MKKHLQRVACAALPLLLAAPAWADDAPAAKLDSGDTAWMLTSTALVLMMTIPGLALFYAGMVRKKNVLATMMQSFIICCLVTVTWMITGTSRSCSAPDRPARRRRRFPNPST
jgi:Amt family ammonium transporter